MRFLVRYPRARPLLAIMVVVITVLVFEQLTRISLQASALLNDDAPVNPFAEYSSIEVGQLTTDVEHISCAYSYNFPSRGDAFSYCMHAPENELIEWMSLSARYGVIERITFRVHLRYGDLVAIFGPAEEKRHLGRTAIFEWQGIYASGTSRHSTMLSMYTPVGYVTFNRNGE